MMRGPFRRVFQDENLKPMGDKKVIKSLRTLYRASKGIDNLRTQGHTAATQSRIGP